MKAMHTGGSRDSPASTSAAVQAKISSFFNPTGEKADSELKGAPKGAAPSKVLNKKRNYAQYHLELGQRGFLLHQCAACGMMYARGDDQDEALHRAHHKNYCDGVVFKGWRDERVVATSAQTGNRVVLVMPEDGTTNRSKVQEVIKMMEKEFGFSNGQLLHKLCKVYLFVSSHRIVGCLVTEPIQSAHRVISGGISGKKVSDDPLANGVEPKRQNTMIHFGNISFQREVVRRESSSSKKTEDHAESGAIICEEEAVPATCGFRAIWVAPSSRRKGIASRLLAVARKSFSPDGLVPLSQCAFSAPTSAGKALARSYFKTSSFLIYKAAV